MSCYLSHIGILHWIVELWRAVIAMELSALVTFMCAPREGHHVDILHLYGWLRKHPRFKVVMDNEYFQYLDGEYPEYDWLEFYGTSKNLFHLIHLNHVVAPYK